MKIESVGWGKRSDTHQLQSGGDGFREGLNPSCGLDRMRVMASGGWRDDRTFVRRNPPW